MSSAHQNLSSKKIVGQAKTDYFRFGMVVAEWNQHITFALADACESTLKENGVASDNISKVIVPGAFELVNGAKLLLDTNQFDAIICIACVIKGDTPHFDYVCQGVTYGIAHLNAIQKTPVIFGVLTVDNEQQALDRCGGIHGNKGDEAAFTAISMAGLAAAIK